MSFFKLRAINKIGKLISYNKATKIATFEFFDSPYKTIYTLTIDTRQLGPNELQRLPLAYFTLFFVYYPENHFWDIGTYLQAEGNNVTVKLLNGHRLDCDISNVFLRENPELTIDPAALLKFGLFNSQFFYDNRKRFKDYVLKQRLGCLGLTGLLSSAVKIVSHQLEVVGRVLRDPIPRYILADEVGLGKTIEAGAILRQHIIDHPNHNEIIVICPDHLIVQWQSELATKFFLGHLFDVLIRFVGFDELNNLQYDPQDEIDVLIIDEAHHIHEKTINVNPEYFNNLLKIASASKKVLLLSGTPALNNETEFLTMLSVLDPKNYSMEDLDTFRSKVKDRIKIGSLYRQFHKSNPLLNFIIDDLIEFFGEETNLLPQLEHLQLQLLNPQNNEDHLRDQIDRIRLYISENYRIHHRILRNSRVTLKNNVTQGRDGLKKFLFTDDQEDIFSNIDGLIQNLIEHYSTISDQTIANNLINHLITEYFNSYAKLRKFLENRLTLKPDFNENAIVTQLLDMIPTARRICAEKITGEILDNNLIDQRNILMFASNEDIELLVEILNLNDLQFKKLDEILDQYNYDSFIKSTARAVILCRDIHQQGLNLQTCGPKLFHFSIPLSPNTIEQRIGRVDRFGSDRPASSFIAFCESESLKRKWIDFLENQLKIFNRSIANLNYLIDEIMVEMINQLRLYGINGLDNLSKEFGGENGKIEIEYDKLSSFENLHSLDSFIESESAIQKLTNLEEDELGIQQSFTSWLKCFNIKDISNDVHIIRYNFHNGILIDNNLLLDKIYNQQFNHDYTFFREKSQKKGIRLSRIGDDFYDAICGYTQNEIRGQIFGTVRITNEVINDHKCFFRFDNILQVSFNEIEADRYSTNLLQRECDIFFPPEILSLIIDENGIIVNDQNIVDLINLPYSSEGNVSYKDYNLNADRWSKFLNLSNLSYDNWNEICSNATEANDTNASQHFENIFMQRITDYNYHLDQFRFIYKDRIEFAELLALKEYLLDLIYKNYKSSVSSCGLMIIASHPFGVSLERI